MDTAHSRNSICILRIDFIIKARALSKGSDLKLIKFDSTEQAQNAPAPFTTYSFFFDGQFVTNEILSEKKFEQFMMKQGMY